MRCEFCGARFDQGGTSRTYCYAGACTTKTVKRAIAAHNKKADAKKSARRSDR